MKTTTKISCYTLIATAATVMLFSGCQQNTTPDVVTLKVTEITSRTAVSGGNVTDDGGTLVEARGICWCSSHQDPTIDDKKTENGRGGGSFISNIDSLQPNTAYSVRAYAINNQGVNYGKTYTFTTMKEASGVKDIDSNDYVTVVIGNKEWMAENLRVNRYKNGDTIPANFTDSQWSTTSQGACDNYKNNEEMQKAYGNLYNWYSVADSRGLCPDKWHVPSYVEWTELLNYLSEQGFPNNDITGGAGNALKSCRQINSPVNENCITSEHPRWSMHPIHYGTNHFGFSALPGGSRWIDGSYYYTGDYGHWWSSTQHSTSLAWEFGIYYLHGNVGQSGIDKSYGYSVRCVKDN
jgi:uncharacterized protein (TIGR02145 family)